MMKTVDISPQMSLKPASQELITEYISGDLPLGQNIGGLQAFSNKFIRGYGNKVFGSDEQGIWLGAADFTDAPFSVDMQGQSSMKSATFKDDNNTTFIDAKGLVSTANFLSNSVTNTTSRQYSNSATYEDIANTSITTESLARTTKVLILYTLNVVEFPINGTTAFAGKVTLKIDSTDQTDNNFELELTSQSPIADTSAWGGPLTASGIVTLASGTHTLKLRAQTINTNSQLNVETSSLIYIILGS